MWGSAFKIVFVGWIFISPLSLAQEVKFTVVKSATESMNSQILGMTQDAQGFLWFSTKRGLFKYDGVSYVAYHHEPLNKNSPSQESIECLVADSAGFIWLAPQWLGLDRLDPVSGVFSHFRHDRNDPASLTNDSVTTLLTDHEMRF